MSKTSRRFTPAKWMEKLVPVILAILLLALLAILVIIGLSVLGQMPGA